MGGTGIDCWSFVSKKFLKLVGCGHIFIIRQSKSLSLKRMKQIVGIAMGLLQSSSIYSTKTFFFYQVKYQFNIQGSYFRVQFLCLALMIH